MPSTEEPTRTEYPSEVVVGILSVAILAGLIAEDIVIAMLFTVLASIAYLLYRILRTLELIVTKL
ncbi:MAG: hypothetical protein ACI8U4_000237 [Natronomonas sp.]|jgi:hypothetical protein